MILRPNTPKTYTELRPNLTCQSHGPASCVQLFQQSAELAQRGLTAGRAPLRLGYTIGAESQSTSRSGARTALELVSLWANGFGRGYCRRPLRQASMLTALLGINPPLSAQPELAGCRASSWYLLLRAVACNFRLLHDDKGLRQCRRHDACERLDQQPQSKPAGTTYVGNADHSSAQQAWSVTTWAQQDTS